MQSDLLSNNDFNNNFDSPLADRLRPNNLDDFYGQESILGKDSLLRNSILLDKVGNIIFSGPPGVGKTTLVEIISANTKASLIKLNAVLSGIKEIRHQISYAKERWIHSRRKTILFIDEVHRFTSVQQDALLPLIENGTITFIGATTENPFYSVSKALLSRSRIFKLLPLETKDLKKIINKVINYYANANPSKNIQIAENAIEHLIHCSGGDARNLINALELAVIATPIVNSGIVKINLSIAKDSIQNKNIIYDKHGQKHYDVISAFIKSIRGSDPDATLYWLANMIEAGEDPEFIFRRLYISASEDIGLANPNAILMVNACSNAFEKVGFPEGQYFLTQASLYLAVSPKSNSTKSFFRAKEILQANNFSLVPDHLQNNSTSYINPHSHPEMKLDQIYLPENLKNIKIWNPSNNGWEKKL
tara:strand:+ start:4455 stop:5714 length:1260 start_codon:yes stop_codon:yes gene_type:complete